MPRYWVGFVGFAMICVGSIADQVSFEEEFDLIENEMDRDFVEQVMARTRERCIGLQADCLKEGNHTKCRNTVRKAPGCGILFSSEEAGTGGLAAVENWTPQRLPLPGAPQQAASPPVVSQSVANGARPATTEVDWEQDTEEDAEEDTEQD